MGFFMVDGVIWVFPFFVAATCNLACDFRYSACFKQVSFSVLSDGRHRKKSTDSYLASLYGCSAIPHEVLFLSIYTGGGGSKATPHGAAFFVSVNIQ